MKKVRPNSTTEAMQNSKKRLSILGIRGIPARHGGFETFAERLALYLIEKGWSVTVYCQEDGRGDTQQDEWRGVHRVRIPIDKKGPVGTMLFDWKAISHVTASDHKELVLTLGYNTALFCARYRVAGISNVINMDGLEWKRDKWSPLQKAWLWLNEQIGCRVGTRLIADHPRIADHLGTQVKRSKISVIPYGADEIKNANVEKIKDLGLSPGAYALVIARPEPENSILEIVRAFSRVKRGIKLVLLGKYDPENKFHRAVISSSSEDIIMPGAIYDAEVVSALRFFAKVYIHGHRVGGTNPSLVEALGAGSAVIAHDNQFNRWVSAGAAVYFADEDSCAKIFDSLLGDDAKIASLKKNASLRFMEGFQWENVLSSYERILLRLGRS